MASSRWRGWSWGLSLSCLAVALAGIAFAGRVTSAVPGDAIVSELTALDEDSVTLYVPAAATLDLRLTASKGLSVNVSVAGPNGDDVPTAGFLRGAPGRRVQLRRLPLQTVGTYTVRVAAVSGSGRYQLKTSLGRRKPERIDLSAGSSTAPGVAIAAGSVTFDPASSGLGARTVQALGEALAARTAQTGSDVASLQSVTSILRADVDEAVGAVSALDARATATESAVVDLQALGAGLADAVDGLDTRVEGLESAASKATLRVVAQLDTPKTFSAVSASYGGGSALSVRRGSILTADVPASTAPGAVVVEMIWRFRPTGAQKRALEGYDHGYAVFAEIGDKTIVGVSAPDQGLLAANLEAELLGLPTGDTELGLQSYRSTIVYRPTESESGTGFKLDVYASVYTHAGGLSGFDLIATSAVVLVQ